MKTRAWAKLNLTLDVLGKREDGYHDLCMVMQSVTLHDTLTLTPNEGQGLRVKTNLRFLPTGDKNLAAAAALRFWEALGREPEHLDIEIQKRIPVCAGMAGGSSDAAAVLRALNELAGSPFTPTELAKVGENVGSDVPYCVLGGTALAEGRGEVLTPLPALPPDTAGMLEALRAGSLEEVARRMYNVFEDVLPERYQARVAEIKHVLIQKGALGANMSGTGPTAFGLFDSEAAAREAQAALQEGYRDTFLCRSV